MLIWYMKERLVSKLITTLRTFGYLFGYLPFSLLQLRQIKAKKKALTIGKYDELVQEVPKKWALGVLKRTKSSFVVSGIENLPEGAVLFISNHEGNFDIPTLIAYIPKPFGFISKIEVKKIPLVSKWMTEMNCVFLDRTNRKSAYQSIKDSVNQLQEGHSILIFPEGTRNIGEGLNEFKAGFARIAKDANVPIVPIAIKGTSDIMEKNNNKIRPAKVQISILPTYSVERIQSNETSVIIKELYTEINNCLLNMKTTI